MKTKRLLSRTLCAAIFAAAMAFGSSAFAQVKIGSNPTIINSTSNLEVESTDPTKKISINKTSGKITIADGSEGNGKVLISDDLYYCCSH